MSKRKFVPVIIALALILALAGVLAACDKTEKEGVFAQAGIPVQDEYGFWGYVNSAGEEVIPFDYTWASPFDNGTAVVATAKTSYDVVDVFDVFYLINSGGSRIAGPYAYAQLIEGGNYAIVAKAGSSVLSEGDVLYGIYDIGAAAMAKDFAYSSMSWDKEAGAIFATADNFTYVWKAADLSDVGVRAGAAESGSGSQGYAYVWKEAADATDEFNAYVYQIYDQENFGFTSVSGNTLNGLGNGWWRISSRAADGSGGTVTNYTYVGEKVVTTFPQSDVTDIQTEEGMLLLTVTNAEGGSEYLLFAANGTQLYSGTQKPVSDSTSGGFILEGENGAYTVFAQGLKFSFTLNAQSTFAGGRIYEDAQTEEVYYGYVYNQEAEDGTISVRRAAIAEDGTAYAFDPSVFGDKDFGGFVGGNVLVSSAGGRVGIADKQGNMLVECIYSDLRALDGGYYAAKLGNAWGVIKADGTQLTGFRFADMGV